jgi:two-component sensor histidine kinase
MSMGRTDRFTLEPDKRAVREARLRVRAFSELPPETEANAELVVSELVANSVLHARLGPDDRIEVTIQWEGDSLAIAVSDPGGFSRRPRTKGGWGFRVLDAVCERWHAESGCVSAVIPVRDEEPRGGRARRLRSLGGMI